MAVFKTIEDAKATRAKFKTNFNAVFTVKNNGVGYGRISTRTQRRRGGKALAGASGCRSPPARSKSPSSRPARHGLGLSAFTGRAVSIPPHLRYDSCVKRLSVTLSSMLLVAVARGCGGDDNAATTGDNGYRGRRHDGGHLRACDQGRARHRHRRSGRPLVQLPRESRASSEAERELGVQGRVVVSRTNADYVPNLTRPGKGEVRPRDRRRLPDGGRAGHRSRRSFGHRTLRSSTSTKPSMKSKPKNVRGLLFKEQEAGYLVGYLAGLVTKEGGSQQVIGSGRRAEDPRSTVTSPGYQAGARRPDPGSRR